MLLSSWTSQQDIAGAIQPGLRQACIGGSIVRVGRGIFNRMVLKTPALTQITTLSALRRAQHHAACLNPATNTPGFRKTLSPYACAHAQHTCLATQHALEGAVMLVASIGAEVACTKGGVSNVCLYLSSGLSRPPAPQMLHIKRVHPQTLCAPFHCALRSPFKQHAMHACYCIGLSALSCDSLPPSSLPAILLLPLCW